MRNEDVTDEEVQRYLPCAAMIARRFSGRGIEFDDLFQVASLALLKAIRRFDADRGNGFVSYLIPSITGEVRNYIRENTSLVHIPDEKRSAIARMHGCETELMHRLHRSPTTAELAEAMGADVERVLELMEAESLHTVVSADDETELPVYLEKGYEKAETDETIKSLLRLLSETERHIVCEHYLNGRSQQQIAEAMGISQMTVSRIEKRALKKLSAIRE